MSSLPEGIRRLPRPSDPRNAAGKVEKPTGRYQARYTIMRDGKPVQISAGTFASLADARDARALAIAKLRTGGWVDPRGGRMNVKDWSEQWIEARPETSAWLRMIITSRIVPAWGDVRLEDVTTLGVQYWVNAMTAEGLSARTVHAYYRNFKMMLNQAVVYGKLTISPCVDRAVKLPKISKTEPVVLTVEDMTVLEKKAPDRYRALISVACWTGMRWGELAGLRWQDVEWERSTLHVQQAAKRDGTVGLPKNGKKRRIPIDAELVKVLRAHRRDFGDGADDLVFTNTRRAQIRYEIWRQGVWVKMIAAVGLDPAPTFHDLRHAHAGHMVMQGMDWMVLSERLGHHNPSFTMDRYGWARPDSHEFTMAALQRARSATS